MIVLSTTRVGETSVVLHAVSKDFARRSFITKAGPKTPSSIFFPVSILEAEIHENPRSDLWRAGNINPVFPLNGLRSNIYKNSMTLFMSEVLYRLLHDDTFEPSVYDWLRKSVLTLDALESDFSNYHLRFLLELAIALGYEPDAESLAPFAEEYYDDIKTLVQSSLPDALLLPLTGGRRNAIASLLLNYISVHSECHLNIRSLKVLHELYG